MGEIYDALKDAIQQKDAVALITEVQGPNPGAKLLASDDRVLGSLGDPDLDRVATSKALDMLQHGAISTVHYGPKGEEDGEEVELFIQSFAPPPLMYVFGAVNLASAVVRIGKFLGYHVTVCDARKVFATKERFPEADEIVVQWPNEFLETAKVDRRTAICILTHDPKFDIPLLEVALKTKAGYIGAMGSRRTHEKRVANLLEVGVSEDELERIQAPLGLDIGAVQPEEVAVAVAAQIIAIRYGRPGGSLKHSAGRIHQH
ncbi:MAG TPA: XdhC/CoxI family protein [Actinomycetota bacterium]|nr:XdhC/CoxI family protein [Actinomycetota bacterium]